jgi:hypothetical protein
MHSVKLKIQNDGRSNFAFCVFNFSLDGCRAACIRSEKFGNMGY